MILNVKKIDYEYRWKWPWKDENNAVKKKVPFEKHSNSNCPHQIKSGE